MNIIRSRLDTAACKALVAKEAKRKAYRPKISKEECEYWRNIEKKFLAEEQRYLLAAAVCGSPMLVKV